MTALSKLLVLIAIFLSASHANAFTSMCPVAGNQVQEKHWFHFEEPMNDPTNEPSCKPNCKPTKQMDLHAEFPRNQSLSTSNQDHEGMRENAALSNCSKQRVSFADQPGIENEINVRLRKAT
jgi:hypothetical protein